MKQSKSIITFLFILSIILFAMACWLYISVKKVNKINLNSQNNLYELSSKLKNRNDLINTLVVNSNIIHQTNGEKFNSSIEIKTEDNKLISIKDIIGEYPKLVFRYSELHCQVCVDQEIKLINEVLQEIGGENVLILSHYDSFRNLSLFKRMNKIPNDVFNVKNIELPPEDYNIPYYCIIDKNLCVREVMIPNKYLPQMSKSYLKNIKKKYFGKIVGQTEIIE